MWSAQVERKFLLPDDLAGLRNRIAAHGGALLGTKGFVDAYYDTPTYSLTLADTWLRLRDEAWELKVRHKTASAAAGHHSSRSPCSNGADHMPS